MAEQHSAFTFVDLFFTVFGELVGMGGFHTGAENLVFSGMVKMSRKKSCWRPTEERKDCHLVRIQPCLSLVSDDVAAAWAVLAAERRAMRK